MEDNPTQTAGTAGRWLRALALACLVLWSLLCAVFLLVRAGVLDWRTLPGAGPVLLGALACALALPVLSIVLAAIALLFPPRTLLGWLTLAGALFITVAQGALAVMSAFI